MMHKFVIFDYRPGFWLAILNSIAIFFIIVGCFITGSILFKGLDSGLILFLIFILYFTFVHFITKFKYREVGNVFVEQDGLRISGKINLHLPWIDIKSIKLRFVDHSNIRNFDFLGGYFRYHHIASDRFSEEYYDKMVINGLTFYLFVKNNRQRMDYLSAIELIRTNTGSLCEIEKNEYGFFLDLFRGLNDLFEKK